jgi:hypothetical protein
MHMFDRVCRAIAAGLLALAVAGICVGPAFAQSKSSKAKVAATALPDPLTHDSIRELVSRLSDDEVRKLLLDQLDRSAVPAKGKGDKAMSGMVEENAGMVRARLGEFRDAFVALPSTLNETIAKLDEPDGPSVLLLVSALVLAALLAGWLAERIFHFALRHYRARLAPPPSETFTAHAFRLAVGLALDLFGIAAFALTFLAIFLSLWQGHGLRRIAILEVLIGVVAVRVTWLLARFLMGGAGKERLLPFSDVPARRLRGFAVLVAAPGVSPTMHSVLAGAGASAPTLDLILMCTSLLGLAIVLWTVWHVRAPIASLIRGSGTHSAVAGWLADLWPVIATAFFVALVVARAYDIINGTPVVSGAGIRACCSWWRCPSSTWRCAGHLRRPRRRRHPRALPCRVSLRPMARVSPWHPYRRDGRRAVAACRPLGRQPVRDGSGEHGRQDLGSLFGMCIVLLLAYLAWEIADGDRPPAGGRGRRACGRAGIADAHVAATAAHAHPDHDRRDGDDELPCRPLSRHPAAPGRCQRGRRGNRLRLADVGARHRLGAFFS